MQNKKKVNHVVHVLTQKTSMRFIPKKFSKLVSKAKIESNPKIPGSTISRFSLSSIWNRNTAPVEKSSSPASEINLQPNSQSQINIEGRKAPEIQMGEKPIDCRLKFATKISNQHILIGNQYQLDLINILGINGNKYVQTEYLWTLKFKDPIDHVNVDKKKFNLLTVICGKILYIYKYDAKKLIQSTPLIPFQQIVLLQCPIFVQVVKDGNICLFYKSKLEVYIVTEKVRRRYDKSYDKPDIAQSQKVQYQLFLVPDPLDNVINIFFEEKNKQNEKIFTLWCIEMEILASEVKSSPPQKIYDIKSGLRKTLTIRNYSKEIFLLNLGSQILAVKKGYILDSANVNLKHEQSLLEYIGNEQILHITKKKIQIYSFIINTNVKPNKIMLKAKDSIKINQNQDNLDQYFRVFQILTDDMIFIFQRSSQKILSKSGQIHYSFYITRATTRQNKMNELFPKGTDQQFKIDDPVLMDKCDMAEKMGFTTREIYLQLWSRSHQTRKEDFKILVATKDYNTIKEEIIRKLKKASMNFKQIRDIQEACFFMLHQRVFSPSCTEEAVMDYISSHFFKRKLEMFKDLQQMEKFQKEMQTGKEQNQVFKMTIRQYQQYKSMSIKTEIVSLVNQFCHEGKKKISKNIRLLLRNFKFVFRIIYYQILEQIIHTSKDKLLVLLQQIPELLPYNSPEHQTSLYIPGGFYDGVWTQITRQEEASSLFVDAITTIDNKQIVLEQVIKNIIFKRNWLSQHDMVTDSRDKIKANYQKIKSPLTFYFFAAKIFEYVNDQKVLKSIVEFLEKTYELPQNLIGNMFLINKLYHFFQERGIAPEINGRPITLSQFFSFEDKQLIRHCFDKQRSNKGLLLKDIKNIFKQVLKEQASFKYNTALLNYFTSDLSQVSDLKYILNRINNQKVQFHQQNQSMYEVLVEALERKLKIGTDNDIPIEQVLIYIQNIPLKFSSSPSKSLNQVKKVEKIDRESDLLRQAKVDMSIYDIIHNHEQVFTKLIDHAIQSSQKQVWESQQHFLDFAIKQIAILETFAEQIYDNDEDFSLKRTNQMIFFIFLAKISEETDRIKFANYLIQNKDFEERVQEYTAQNLVLFMKKWKLTIQKQYRKNEEYIQQLLKLLPEDTNQAIYIRCQLQFARILSAPQYPVTYPISENNCTVMSSDLRDIIFELPADFLLKMDIRHLYDTLQKMQQIFLSNSQQQELNIMNKITLHQIYEFVIIKLINCNKLKEVLPIIRQILTLEIADTTYNIIYMMLFIIQISPEFNETNKNNLLQSMSFYFYEPIALLEIMEYLLNNRLNSSQVKKFLEDSLEKGKSKHKSYNESNSLFQQEQLKSIQSKADEQNFMGTLQKTGKNLQQAKQQFKNIKYSAIMIMLCNSPYALAKFVSCSYNYEQHIKSLRSFLSYAINQSVFKPYSILQLGKRIFYILLEASQKKQPIESVIQRYQSETLENDLDMQNYMPPKDKNSFEYIMWKSAQAFKKKKMAYKPERLSVQNQIEVGKEQGQASHPSQYPFTEIDSDNQLNQQVNQSPKKPKAGQLKKLPTFNASQEMNLLLQQNDKGNKLFRSTRAQGSAKTYNNLSVSIRQPNRSAPTNNLQQTADLKYQHKITKQKFFDQVGQLNQSQDFNEHLDCKTEREQKLRPSSSVISSDPRRSADSSPEILLNRFDQRGTSGQDPFSLEKINNREIQKSFEEDEKLQESRSNASNIYAIKVKQAYDPEEMSEMNKNIPDNYNEPQMMVQSTELGNPITQIVTSLIESNKDALDNPLADFDLTSLDSYSNDKPMLQSVIRALYRQYVDLPNLNKIMKLIGAIVNFFPACQINADIFNSLIKAQQVQSKTIPQIPFGSLITELTITHPFDSRRHLFDELYKNLKKHIDSQNIYKITQFIRRVFDDNSDYEQQVTWDFILELCDKIQNCEEEDKNWNVQKIQATLPKVQVHIWSAKIQSFRQKVLQSPCKDLLLQIFCNYLGYKKGDEEAIQFLQNLLELDESTIIKQTLESVK